jgi:hypothetical protein
MKTRKLFGILALLTIIFALVFTACDTGSSNGGKGNGGSGGDGTTGGGGGQETEVSFNNITELKEWLDKQPINEPATAYKVKVKINDLGSYDSKSLGSALSSNYPKYVKLNLSGSTAKSIQYEAFNDCRNLISIIIPDGITSIGNKAFYNCTSLTSVTIPDSVTSIGDNAFQLTGLINVTIPSKVTSIGKNVFTGCKSLTSVNIPDSVTSIGSGAFAGCDSLTSLNIPANVTSIDEYAFFPIQNFTGVNVSTANTAYSSENGVLYNKNKTILYIYPTGKKENSFTIPDGVTSIGKNAFWNGYSDSDLLIITIPNSVTSIVKQAFYQCTGLTSITIPTNVTSIGEFAFGSCSNLTTIKFEGLIPSSGLANNLFYEIGDLLDKYLAGGKGTYTRPIDDSTWTKIN